MRQGDNIETNVKEIRIIVIKFGLRGTTRSVEGNSCTMETHGSSRLNLALKLMIRACRYTPSDLYSKHSHAEANS
jgi:hypothetical protein